MTGPDYVRTVVAVQRALRAGPRQAAELAQDLGVGRRTVERILAGLVEAGEPVAREARGREVFYSLP